MGKIILWLYCAMYQCYLFYFLNAFKGKTLPLCCYLFSIYLFTVFNAFYPTLEKAPFLPIRPIPLFYWVRLDMLRFVFWQVKCCAFILILVTLIPNSWTNLFFLFLLLFKGIHSCYSNYMSLQVDYCKCQLWHLQT